MTAMTTNTLHTAELLNSKLAPINKSFDELERDSVIQRKEHVNYKELFRFVRSSLATYQSLAAQFKNCLSELQAGFGPLGQAGNALEIKSAVDRLIQICRELLAWEYDLNGIIPPEGLETVKLLMKGWSKIFIDDINTIAPKTLQMVSDHKAGLPVTGIFLTLRTPDGMEDIAEPFRQYIFDNNITDPLSL